MYRARNLTALVILTAFVVAGQVFAAPPETPVSVDQELIVLLRLGPSHPTPRQVIDAANSGSPASGGLGEGNPMAGEFAIRSRAYGPMKAFYEANPDLAAARHQRYIVLQYPNPNALEGILTATVNAQSGNIGVLWGLCLTSNCFATVPGREYRFGGSVRRPVDAGSCNIRLASHSDELCSDPPSRLYSDPLPLAAGTWTSAETLREPAGPFARLEIIRTTGSPIAPAFFVDDAFAGPVPALVDVPTLGNWPPLFLLVLVAASRLLMIRRRRDLAIVFTGVVMLASVRPAVAQLFPVGPERQLETEGCGHSAVSLGVLGNQDFLAAWKFLHPSGSVHAVQRLDSEFSPGAYRDLGFGRFHDVSFAPRPDGGTFAVAWDQVFGLDQSGALDAGPLDLGPAGQGKVVIGPDGPVVLAHLGDELWLRRFLPDLTPIDSSLLVSGPDFRDTALLRVGNSFLAVWSEPRLPGILESRIWARRFDGSGAAMGPRLLLAEGVGILKWETAAHPDIGVGVVWTEYRSSELWFQTWDATAGNALSGSRLIHDTDLKAGAPSLAAWRAGWVVGWLGPGSDQKGEVRVRLLDFLGEPEGASQALSEPMSRLFPGHAKSIKGLDLAVARNRLMAAWGVFLPHIFLPDPCDHYFSPRFREFQFGAPGPVAVPTASVHGMVGLVVILLACGLFLVGRQ